MTGHNGYCRAKGIKCIKGDVRWKDKQIKEWRRYETKHLQRTETIIVVVKTEKRQHTCGSEAEICQLLTGYQSVCNGVIQDLFA